MTTMNNEDPADPSVHERQDAYRCIAPACKPLGCSMCNCAVPADVYERAEKRGSWTLRGPELQTLGDGLFIARIQLEHCSLGEFEKARKRVAERIRHARGGRYPDGAHVVGE